MVIKSLKKKKKEALQKACGIMLFYIFYVQLTKPTHTGGSAELTYPRGWSVAEGPVFYRLKKKKKKSLQKNQG